jgi:hypothetical protein
MRIDSEQFDRIISETAHWSNNDREGFIKHCFQDKPVPTLPHGWLAVLLAVMQKEPCEDTYGWRGWLVRQYPQLNRLSPASYRDVYQLLIEVGKLINRPDEMSPSLPNALRKYLR